MPQIIIFNRMTLLSHSKGSFSASKRPFCVCTVCSLVFWSSQWPNGLCMWWAVGLTPPWCWRGFLLSWSKISSLADLTIGDSCPRGCIQSPRPFSPNLTPHNEKRVVKKCFGRWGQRHKIIVPLSYNTLTGITRIIVKAVFVTWDPEPLGFGAT